MKLCRNLRSKYILPMFPYPSGRLHLGHLRVYTLSDVISRYHRLKGHQVIHPIGWDAFGLPAENAARERGIDPAEWTYKNIEEMRTQLSKTGVNFDWNREIFTCRPDYFRWTQWIFIQLFRHGFVRKTLSEVNWDPVDGTVLADEQVDDNGCSWRSGAKIEKRLLRQWAIETPRYAKRLLDGLSSLEAEWGGVVGTQADWIGTCDVHRFLLQTEHSNESSGHGVEQQQQQQQFDLRLADPAQLGTAQFVVITTEHSLAKEAAKQGKLSHNEPFTILDNLCLLNFVTGQRLPIVVAKAKPSRLNTDFVLDARLGDASSADPLDRAVAERLCLSPLAQMGISSEEVLALAKDKQLGGYLTSRRLGDWVVSRQRGWGTPIPMLTDEDGAAGSSSAVAPVAEQQLPVLIEMRGQRMETDSFPSGWGRVETDTLDTFFDSSWYYLRYLDPHNSNAPFDPDIVRKHMPVDIYIGGMEHAKVHLFYARFIYHFLHELGMVPSREPFAHFIQLGVVRAPTYKLPDGRYVPDSEVDGNKKLPNSRLVHKGSGQPVQKEFEKMSKSKHNGVDPMGVIDSYGLDETRMQLLIEARPNYQIDWPYPYPTFQLKTINRWVLRVRTVVDNYVTERQRALSMATNDAVDQNAVEQADRTFLNHHTNYVKKISSYLDGFQSHNMALTRLHHFTKALVTEAKALSKGGSSIVLGHSAEFERCIHSMLVMAQVFAPCLATEQWAKYQAVPKLNDQLQRQAEKPINENEWPTVVEDDDDDVVQKAEME
ncbi:hypothetical protein niasHT_002118 [Heterodera trifolii]|uniref:leucine--tRNA ligase n=1 Tax=Heterodera trifolii TaxID=157864 RepID=A0ABD2MCZ7_9BILA